MKRQRGFSLIEFMVATVLVLVLTYLSIPALVRPLQDSYFHVFASELTASLIYARRASQLSGHRVRLDLRADDQTRFSLVMMNGNVVEQTLTLQSWGHGYDRQIENRLLPGPLPHPTSGRIMSRALSSSHNPFVYFTESGSSNATLVYSDGVRRAVCAVISGTSGRFRVYLWDQDAERWLDYF